MRRNIAALAGCAVVATAGTCTAAVAAPEAAAIDTTTAKALAKAGVLTAKDMKGYEGEKITVSAEDVATEKKLYSCLGIKPKYAARNHGYDYGSGSAPMSITSAADVATTVALAKADIAALKGSKAASCFKKAYTAAAQEQGLEVTSMSVTVVPVTVSGAAGAAGHQYVIKVKAGDQAFTLRGSWLIARVGQTEITLSPVTFDGSAPGFKQAKSLAAKLVTRVKAV